jgi:hypothetical protein
MSDTDLELLARYTRHHAEDAFSEVVRRHFDLVHSARCARSAHQLAEEVAQSVFTDLARHVSTTKAELRTVSFFCPPRDADSTKPVQDAIRKGLHDAPLSQ